jgi:hypothetical protein
MEKTKPIGLYGDKEILIPSYQQSPEEPKKKTKDITVCVIDKGGYLDFALELAKQVKKVYYWTPCYISMDEPQWKDALTGCGFEDEGLVRIKKLFTDYDDTGYKFSEVDLFMFLENYYADWHEMLVKQGRHCWSGGYAENLELLREQSMGVLNDVGLAVTGTKIKGLDTLESYLKDKKNMWIKTSMYRGLFETFRWDSYEESKSEIDDCSVNKSCGAGDWMQFVAQKELKTENEPGIDSYTVDGMFPDAITHGFERKNKSYVETYTLLSELDKANQICIKKLSPVLKKIGLRGFYADEKKVMDDKTVYLTDITAPRLPSPPNQILSRLYTNFAEIAWFGSHGILKQPKFAGRYGMMIFCESDWNGKHEVMLNFDKSIRDNISIGNCYKKDGKIWAIPTMHEGGGTPCTVVAIANTVDECGEILKKVDSKLKIHKGSIDLNEIEELKKLIEMGEERGQEF